MFRTLQTVANNDILLPLVEEGIMRQDWPEEYPIKVYNKERIWDGYFHPSSDALMGDLELFYKFSPRYFYQEERLTPTSILTMQIGSAFHSLFQSLLIHLGLTAEEYVEVSFKDEERHCSGTIDVQQLVIPGRKDRIPLEIKSCSQIPQKPITEHVYQFQPYMDLGCEEPQELGLILYICKSYPHHMREFQVYRDEEVLSTIYEKWDRVWDAVENDRDDSEFRPCCNGPGTPLFEGCPAKAVCKTRAN